MRLLRRSLFPFLLVIAATALTMSSGAPQANQPLPGTRPRAIFAPYYTVGGGFKATLGLNNSTRAAFDVRPTIYSLDGDGVPMPPVRLEAHEFKQVDVSEWVAPLGARFATGSVQLEYESVGFGLGSVLSMVNEAESLVVDVILQSRGVFKSSRLEGLWWAQNREARLTLAVLNTTDRTLVARLILTSEDGGEIRNQPLPLAPHQTHVADLSSLARRDVGSVGGISIQHEGTPGAIMAQAFVVDRKTGFSANLPLVDPAKSGDAKLEGAGILLGKGHPGAQVSDFRGRLLLRNTSGATLKAAPVLQRGNSNYPLEEIALGPGHGREIRVPAGTFPPGEEPVGIQIRHTGEPGDLVGHWFSVDDSGSLVVETPLRSPAPDERVGGNHPWSLEGDTSSVLYVKNSGSDQAAFVVAILYPGGQYISGKLEIGPGATRDLKVRELRDRQIPDSLGRLLPPDLVIGKVVWRWASGSPLVGRVNMMSRTKGIASNMSCPACCCYPDDAVLTLDPFATSAFTGDAVQEEIKGFATGCDGLLIQPPDVVFVEWGSNNPLTAIVNPDGIVVCGFPGFAIVAAEGIVRLEQPSILDPNYNFEVDVECQCSPVFVSRTAFATFFVQTRPTVTVSVADIVNDRIVVSLSPSEYNGNLLVQTVGPGPSLPVFNGPTGGGSRTFSFNREGLLVGQYTAVQATWTVNGRNFSGTKSVSFNVLGSYRHSQYNTPNESSCTGAPASAYKTQHVSTLSCTFNPVNLKSDFISQSWLNGSGITISFGSEQNESLCFGSQFNPPAPADAMGRSFRPGPIVPTCLTFVSNSTVARGDDANLSCGDQVLIIGLGGPGQATVKTVTDRCPRCTGQAQLDNYTTQPNCQPGTIPDLGTFKTIRLR